jgi:putative glutamine amidotransferase
MTTARKRVLVPLAEGEIGPGGNSLIAHTYLTKLEARNVLPLLISPVSSRATIGDLQGMADGLLLLGGVDINPARYRAVRHPETEEPSNLRDALEIQLVHDFLSTGKPIFGICRGSQLLNVALGGALIQHVPDITTKPHRPEGKLSYIEQANACLHEVTVTPGSKLHSILGTENVVMNSMHHQAVDTPGNGMQIVGRSSDGIAELFEHETHPFCIATQGHPEAMSGTTDAIWDAFVAAL